MFYRRPRAAHHRSNYWLIASIVLIGCAGRAQSTCDSGDQCSTTSGGHGNTGVSHSSGGTASHTVEAGVSGGRMGGAGKGGAGGKGTAVTVDPRSDGQLPSVAGRPNGGADNSGGGEPSAGGAASTGSGGAAALGGSAGGEALATTGWCGTPYCVFGTTSADGGLAVAVDVNGNIYVAGSTSGALVGTNAGAADAFVRKLDVNGAVVWTRQFGTSSDDWATSIAVDSGGNVYVAGDTYGALEGANLGSADSFLRKLDKSGTTLWTRQFGSKGPEQLGAVTLDASGNAYVAGSTYPTGNQSSGDPYVRKFDASGSAVWAKQFGGADEDEAETVAVDASGNVYVAGWTYDLIPESKVGSWDAFVRKLDASGAPLWTRVFGTTDADVLELSAVDSEGNLYVAGTSAGDALVRKYDPSGATLWTQQVGTSGYEYGAGLGLDGSNNVYVVGSTDSAFSGSNAGKQDVFIRKLDKSGATLWTKQIGTSSDEAARGATADASGTVFVVGAQGDLVNEDAFLLRVAAQVP
ncbi:MAG TPA: SBBP repeat-containing protein [Polyangiaceae bacterium]|nr:SBBP repeat-containing protein [Polyangiaceae bacterium]